MDKMIAPFFAQRYTPSEELHNSLLFLLCNKIEHGETLLREMSLLSWVVHTGELRSFAPDIVEAYCQLGKVCGEKPAYSCYVAFFNEQIASALGTLTSLPPSVHLSVFL